MFLYALSENSSNRTLFKDNFSTAVGDYKSSLYSSAECTRSAINKFDTVTLN
jgi:hypothetical protein